MVRSSGAVIVAQRPQPRRAEDAAGLLELRMHGLERRLKLLVGRRQLDGEKAISRIHSVP